MRRNSILLALASASALGMVATAAERQRGRLMRAPDHGAFDGPTYMYGPNGQSGVFEAAGDVPTGWKDHPSKVGNVDQDAGTKTARAPANSTTTAEDAAKTTAAKSQTQTDPAISAQSGVGGEGKSAPSSPETVKPDGLDAHGHPYDPAIHAGTGTKTKDGLWRLKVGAKRPEPAKGYPLDL